MALKFNGTGNKVSHGDIAALDSAAAVSFAIWANITDGGSPNSLGLVAKDGTAGTDNHYLFVDGASVGGGLNNLFGITDGSSHSSYSAAGTLPFGSWVHIGWTFNGAASLGSRFTPYINGVAVAVGADPMNAAFADMGTKVLQVGFTSSFTSPASQLANLKMWTAVLTADEMRKEYINYEPQRAANLLLWAPYDDDGEFGKDYSGNANHGTLTGTTTGDVPVPFRYPAAMTFPSRGAGRRQLKEPRNRFTTPNAGGVGLKIPRKMYG